MSDDRSNREAECAVPDAAPLDGRPLGGILRSGLGLALSPATLTIAFLAVTGLVFYFLGIDEGGDPFAENRAWLTWKIAAALGIAIGALLGTFGVVEIVRVWRSMRSVPGPTIVYSAAAAVALFVLIMLFLRGEAGGERAWPIENIAVRLGVVSWTVALSATPWLALVWIAHASLRHGSGPLDTQQLLRRWALLLTCVSVFAVYVVISLVPTGALRSAWLSQDPDDPALAAEFPAADVLLYGAFFAVLLTAIAIRLAAIYRASARALVDATFVTPHDRRVEKEWAEGRQRLEQLLHLDVGLLRNPLTALSIFTPLVTAALAAFLPELRQG